MVVLALVSRRAFVVAKRERWRTPMVVGIGRAYRGRASGVVVESMSASRRPRHTRCEEAVKNLAISAELLANS